MIQLNHTCCLVNHVHLQWEVLSIYGVLAGRVEVELLQLELLSSDGCLGSFAFHDNFDGSTDIFELSSSGVGKFDGQSASGNGYCRLVGDIDR